VRGLISESALTLPWIVVAHREDAQAALAVLRLRIVGDDDDHVRQRVVVDEDRLGRFGRLAARFAKRRALAVERFSHFGEKDEQLEAHGHEAVFAELERHRALVGVVDDDLVCVASRFGTPGLERVHRFGARHADGEMERVEAHPLGLAGRRSGGEKKECEEDFHQWT